MPGWRFLMISERDFKQILENMLAKKTKKQLIDYIKRLQAKYNLLECEYLDWEAEGSICKGGHGTGYGRCAEQASGTTCQYKVLK